MPSNYQAIEQLWAQHPSLAIAFKLWAFDWLQ